MPETQGVVLVPVDTGAKGGRAIATARDLATATGSRIRLVTVVGDAADSAEAQSRLTELGQSVPVPVDVRVIVSDDVPEAIVTAAADAVVVCMATAASLLPHGGHFGSIAEHVVRALDRPVALVGPRADPAVGCDIGRVIVPIDGSPASEVALDPAAGLAKLLDRPLWVVTVVSPDDERRAVEAMGIDAPAGESGYVATLARGVAREYGVRAEFEVLHIPDPADAILDFAQPDGIVVMSTHGRTGLARLFAGSVTTSVVARAEHPVVVVHAGEELGG